MSERIYKDGVYRYVHSGESQTKDDVLTELTTWKLGQLGQAYTSGTFGPFTSLPNGTIFKDAVFYNFIKFGDGCIFENCKFNWIPAFPFSSFGSGCVFSNCTLNGVSIPSDAVIGNSKIGVASVSTPHINNKGKSKDLPAISVTNDEHKGTRIDSAHTEVTKQSGIKGYTNVGVSTNGSENVPQQI